VQHESKIGRLKFPPQENPTMAPRGSSFLVDTRPTKDVVVDGLTKDATVIECILDLIDNSIDAARDTVFERSPGTDSNLLLDDYSEFKIELTFSGDGLSIADNCKGMESEALRKSVLRFGERSFHEMGIGLYGVGLNRAMFKLGRRSELHTDTGKERSRVILNVDRYLKSEDWNLPARRFQTRKKQGTSLQITKLPTEISQAFADNDWIKNLRQHVGRRYGSFLSKGLTLVVNGIPVEARTISIRENSPFQEQYKTYRTGDGVSVHLHCGQHVRHRFNGEEGYDEASNRALTPEFGWTVLCNDRVILVANTAPDTGWEGKFHSEFYGFVGTVSFVASDPGKLPWNTKKTGVDLNNPAYKSALADMRKFAEVWRSFAARRKKTKSLAKLPALPPANTPATTPGLVPVRTFRGLAPAPPRTAPPTKKEDHHSARTVLTDDIDEAKISDKLLALVHEGKTLDMLTHSYSGLALIRMLFEASVSQFFIRRGEADALQKFAITAREKRDPTKTIDEKKVVATMDEMIDYLDQHPDIWGTGKQSMLKHSLSSVKAHKPKLNGVLHNPFQPIDRNEAFTIRTDILPILRYLIET
jgi:hypothetical protein